MTRRIPARFRYIGIAARRHPHRDRNKHRLAWGEWDWACYYFERACTAVADELIRFVEDFYAHP